MQYFKGDDLEKKFEAAASDILDQLGVQKDSFFDGAYSTGPLGDLIYTDSRSPLSKAILQSIFRATFNDIFAAFVVAGSFESYISVFKKIFGDTVGIVFTVPAPGKLQIAIDATDPEEDDLLARYILDNAYVFDELIDYDGNNIAVDTVKGFQSQYELEQMLFELVPDGVYTEITLTLG